MRRLEARQPGRAALEQATTTITGYHALTDGSISLTPSERRNARDFNPAHDIKQGGLDNAILCFGVIGDHAKNLLFKLEINGTQVIARKLNGSDERTSMETMQQTLSKGDNTVQDELDNRGSGRVTVSDLIIFFKRDT